ncbi:MAG: hypothetical protein JJU29_00260 [Verrucomicrobia bacterium]|nr:hypothetical protein [Verrucomicrobiota bacterium]
MQKITILVGVLLSLLGLVGYSLTAFEHITAGFPLFFGLPIAYCGWAAIKNPEKNKLYMHIAVGCAAFLFLGSVTRLPWIGGHEDQKVLNKAVSLWGTAFLTFLLLGVYIQSFLKARSGPSVGETPTQTPSAQFNQAAEAVPAPGNNADAPAEASSETTSETPELQSAPPENTDKS